MDQIARLMWVCWVTVMMLIGVSGVAWAGEYLGNLNPNRYDPNSVNNPDGEYGSPYGENSIHNPYGKYGSRHSNRSANNPYAGKAPKLYDRNGRFRGTLSTNPNDPNSINNPYGRYGNPYSSDSINNPYGAGNPYRTDGPLNPNGSGWTIIGD